MRKASFGYCAVTADFFHIGHLRLLKRCKQKCHKLIVGVMTDRCVKKYKGKLPIMTYTQRKQIIESLKLVWQVRPQDTFEFPHDVLRMKNHYGKNFLIFDNADHMREGADVYLDYFKGISSRLYKLKNLI